MLEFRLVKLINHILNLRSLSFFGHFNESMSIYGGIYAEYYNRRNGTDYAL